MGRTATRRVRVAVLGANGQVGSELCLYLKVMGFCEPVAVARSGVSMAFLLRAGIPCRFGDLTNPQVAAELLHDCDLIFDLALPSGKNLRETKRMVRARLTSIFSVARPSRGFVLASTTAVFRYSASIPFFRAYRAMKLLSERLSQQLGSCYQVPVYVFRLGEVHGEFQSCSVLLRQDLSRTEGPIYVPDQPSSTIFVFGIAEAIRAVLFERIPPIVYSVVSDPALSFADVIEWNVRRLGLNRTVAVEAIVRTSPFREGLLAVRNWIQQGLSQLIGHYKDLLSAIVSAYSEQVEQKLRFARMRKIAASTIDEYFDRLRYRPFAPLNEIPGIRFPFAADYRARMEEADQRVHELIQRHK